MQFSLYDSGHLFGSISDPYPGTPGARRLRGLPEFAPRPDRRPEHRLPRIASASRAFPSSSNSSTLSELAVGRLDSPCKSPDCPSCRFRGSSDGKGTVSTTKPVLATLLRFAENSFFLAKEYCLEAALFRATFLFGVIFFLGTAFFRFVCLFLFGMRSVYPR